MTISSANTTIDTASPFAAQVLLLAGGHRIDGLDVDLGIRSWQFPLTDKVTVLDGWRLVAESAGMDQQPYLILESKRDREIAAAEHSMDDHWRLEYDIASHRGTAGAIADLIRHRPDQIGGPENGWILVVESSASPAIDLRPLLHAPDDDDDVAIVLGASELDRYCGCMLVRRSAFVDVPEVGFYDLKEQLLPRIREAGCTIKSAVVAKRALKHLALPGWLETIRTWRDMNGLAGDPSVISRTAKVDSAVIDSSIIMENAVVERGAVVARSVVGPVVRVRAGQIVSDTVLAVGGSRDSAMSRESAVSSIKTRIRR